MFLEYEWQLLPVKTKMAAILDVFFSVTLNVSNYFRNRFSIKTHVEIRHYIKIYV